MREVQATLVMSPEGAIVIGNWLVGKGRDALLIRKQADDTGTGGRCGD